jgi:hypothetical protein
VNPIAIRLAALKLLNVASPSWHPVMPKATYDVYVPVTHAPGKARTGNAVIAMPKKGKMNLNILNFLHD